MSFNVHIKNKESGEVTTYIETYYDDEGKFNIFHWTEGNYGCDCNRHLFFQQSSGVSEENMTDVECGEELYSIIVTDETGNIIYDEH